MMLPKDETVEKKVASCTEDDFFEKIAEKMVVTGELDDGRNCVIFQDTDGSILLVDGTYEDVEHAKLGRKVTISRLAKDLRKIVAMAEKENEIKDGMMD